MTAMHAPRPCKSCPFRVERSGYFEPDTLDKTVGENLRGEQYIHRCHSDPKDERLCTGFIRYLVANDIADQNGMFRVFGRLGALDLDGLDKRVEIFADWDDLLESHAEAVRDAEGPVNDSKRRQSPGRHRVDGDQP